MTLIDTHSHIYDESFDADRSEAIARAVECGISRILLPGIDSSTHEAMLGVCREYPGLCIPMMGFHPTSVNDNDNWEEEVALAGKYLAEIPEAGFCAVGEIGLDLHWSRDFLREQTEAFARQIEFAIQYDLPVVVHTREAWPQTIALLKQYKSRGIRGVMHSYSGTADDYRTICSLGDFRFGIAGPVTYKNSALAATVAEMEIGHILLETDCPYLPPVPFRGRRNESAHLPLICEKVAQIKGLQAEEVARITTANASETFRLGLHD